MESLSASAQIVKTQLDALRYLQGLDNEINQRRQQIQKLEKNDQESKKNVTALRQALDQQKQDVDKRTKERREAERQVKEKQEQIVKLGGQLYEVKNNEAYNALQLEIKQKKQEAAMLEERILEMMVSDDEAQAIVAKVAAELKAGENQLAGVEAQFHQAVSAIEAEIAGIQSEWEAKAKDVQPDHLNRYVRLRDAKGGMGLAKIENGTCTGCRLHIRPQAEIDLQKYRSLLFCDNCARILFVE